ncbi:hypothetical protein DYU05_00015 [Mucilaginibacter terrenus]|uniref:Uncharacterized protein n=1 Tax=Mucilaginibacter terrenus TaxID=2482727 RepID=A0A3E2NSR2_9SPHI|nr:hypothetical protein DYU05_00015 [Mucilaginibacter terrenus]
MENLTLPSSFEQGVVLTREEMRKINGGKLQQYAFWCSQTNASGPGCQPFGLQYGGWECKSDTLDYCQGYYDAECQRDDCCDGVDCNQSTAPHAS